jgi:hypothetical protein
MYDNGAVLDALKQLRALAAECADAPGWPLSDAEVIEFLDTVHTAEQTLAAAKLHLISQISARGIPARQHHRTCASWLRQRLRIGSHTAARLAELARTTDQRPNLDQALGIGAVNTEQATVIAETLEHLPADAGREVVDKAGSLLIGWAGEFDPHGLRKLGHRVLEHVDPELADRVDAAALDREQARAHGQRSFTLSPLGDGRVRLSGYLDTEAAALVSAALDPLCTPRPAGQTKPPQHLAADNRTPADSTPADSTTLGSGQQRVAGPADIPVPDERSSGQRQGHCVVGSLLVRA